MNALLTAIRGERSAVVFRAAFRAVGGAAGAIPNDANGNFIIDQFNHDHITAAEAGAAFNRGWIYGLEISRTGAGVGPQVSIDGGAN